MSDHVEGKENGVNQPPASGAQSIPALIDVPPLPPHYVPRPAALAEIKTSLLTDAAEPVGLIGAGATIGVQGMGGVGKSVLAAALARDPDLARAFPDGIIWLAIGRDADETRLRALQTRLARAFQNPTAVPSFVTSPEGRTHLEKLLAGRRCLLILDDVWNVEHADAMPEIKPPARMLVTTRHREVLRGLNATQHPVDALPPEGARELLANSAHCLPSQLPAVADEVARACGHLPLALAIAGALVRDRPADRWQAVLDQLRASNLAFFRQQFRDYPYPDLLSVIEVSVNTLSPGERARYFDLAVFPQDAAVPERTLAVLWADEDPCQCSALVELFIDRSLVRRGDHGNIELHQLQHEYICNSAVRARAEVLELVQLHQRLLEAYARTCDGRWAGAMNDGYFFEHLADHLLATGHHNEVRQLAFDLPWLQARLNATDANGIVADCERANSAEHSEPPPLARTHRGQTTTIAAEVARRTAPELVAGAVCLASHILANDKAQLAGQLRGRLLSCDSPEVQALLAQASTPPLPTGSSTLLPLHPTLTPPGGPLLRTLADSTPVYSCTVLPDGRRALAGSDEMLQIWDLRTGLRLRSLSGHAFNYPVICCAVASQGRQALSGSTDATLKVWDVETGAYLRTLEGHNSAVSCCVVFGNGRTVLSGSNDNTLKIWDLDTGVCVRTLEGHRGWVSCCAVLGDGRRALSGSGDNTLKIWDLETGDCLRTLRTGNDWVSCCAVLSNGRRALSGSGDNTLTLWDLETGSALQTLAGHNDHVRCCALLPHGRAISGSDDRTLRVWDLITGECLRVMDGHAGAVTSCVVFPNGRRLLSTSQDNTLKIWDLETGACLRMAEKHASSVTSCVALPGGRRALSASADGTLNLWSLESGTCVPAKDGSGGMVTSSAALPDGRNLLLGSQDNTLKVWNLETGTPLMLLVGHESPVRSCVVLPDGQRALSASDDKTLKLWNLQTGACLRTLEGHDGPVWSCAVLPDARRALSSSDDKTLKVWNLDSGECLRTLVGHSDWVTSCAISPDGRQALSGSDDMTLRIWDLETGSCLRILQKHSGWIRFCTVLSDGRRALSGSYDKTLKVWDLRSGAVLGTFTVEDEIRCCALAPDRALIIAGDASGRVHFLTLTEVISENIVRPRPGMQCDPHPTPRQARRTPKRHVFLSYCHDNTIQVADVRAALIAAGEPVWWDQDILPGQDWKYAIREALKAAYAVVLCLSAEAQQRVKSGIFPEAMDAIGMYREYSPGAVFLIPVRLSDCEIPPIEIDATRTLDRLQYIDLFHPAARPAAIARLVASIRQSPDHP